MNSKRIKEIWAHILPRRRNQVCLLLVLMILASLGEMVSIGVVVPFLGVLVNPEQIFANELAAPLIELLGINQPNELLLPLTLLFVITTIISGILRVTLLWAQTRLGYAIGADISFQIYQVTLYQTYAKHLSRNTSEVIAGITEKSNGVVAQVIMPLLILCSSILLMISILATLVAINPLVALSAFICFGLIYGLIILASKQRLLFNSQRISVLLNRRIKALQEGLGGIRDVILDSSHSTYTKVYRAADIPLRAAQASNTIISGTPRFGIEALGMVLIAGLAYTLMLTGDGISDAIPVLGALAIGAQRMLPVLQQGYASLSNIRGAQEILNDALKLLEQPLPTYFNNPLPPPMVFDKEIVVKNLGFRYSPKTPWVLRNLDLKINKGDRVGLIGVTGSGKSTLLDILMGLLEPDEGELLVDNTTIDEENHRAWRGNIANVPQTIFLADASITENIALGVSPEDIEHDWVRKSAEMAQIAETIEGWDEQYNKIVGERGIRLSGGQRQRIGIARALYKKANIIVFDEATNALDSSTEIQVMKNIDNINKDVTMFIIAHRISTLENCDSIIELEEGKIKRICTYQDIAEGAHSQ